MEWNERVAAARKAAGLTQETLGEKLGVSRQAVSKWESGQAVPDLDTVAKLFTSIGSAREDLARDFVQFCGKPDAYARELVRLMENGSDYRVVLRRDLPDSAALFLAQHLNREYLDPKIVLDEGEPQQELLGKTEAMTIPARPSSETKSGLGFWGVVGAVVVALLILSFL